MLTHDADQYSLDHNQQSRQSYLFLSHASSLALDQQRTRRVASCYLLPLFLQLQQLAVAPRVSCVAPDRTQSIVSACAGGVHARNHQWLSSNEKNNALHLLPPPTRDLFC